MLKINNKKMDAEQAKAIADKQSQLALKKQVIAADSVLKDFNWNVFLPLDQSFVQKSHSAQLNHAQAREVSALQRDVKAPVIEFTFRTQQDDAARRDVAECETQKVNFSKVQLQ